MGNYLQVSKAPGGGTQLTTQPEVEMKWYGKSIKYPPVMKGPGDLSITEFVGLSHVIYLHMPHAENWQTKDENKKDQAAHDAAVSQDPDHRNVTRNKYDYEIKLLIEFVWRPGEGIYNQSNVTQEITTFQSEGTDRTTEQSTKFAATLGAEVSASWAGVEAKVNASFTVEETTTSTLKVSEFSSQQLKIQVPSNTTYQPWFLVQRLTAISVLAGTTASIDVEQNRHIIRSWPLP